MTLSTDARPTRGLSLQRLPVEISYIQNLLFSLSTLSMQMNCSRLTMSTMEKVNFICSLSRPRLLLG